MECVDLQTFHKHYCAMVISYNVANCFFRWGSCCFYGFFLYFFGGWVSLSLGILSEVLSGRDFVGHFVRGGGGCRGFYPEGLLSFFLSGGFLTGRVCRGGFVGFFFIGGVFAGGGGLSGSFCRGFFAGRFLSGDV